VSLPSGAAGGYRPGATLSFTTELRRQASRRRTRLTLGFMVALPLIVLAAFEFGGRSGGGGGGDRGQFAALADIATSGGLNFALFTLLVSSSFLLVVVVALFCGDTVASEASWGSLRYLLAIPVPRGRLLGSKLLVSLLSSLVALLDVSLAVDAAVHFDCQPQLGAIEVHNERSKRMLAAELQPPESSVPQGFPQGILGAVAGPSKQAS